MQPAYTAGLFWLFQNAALKDIETKEAVDSAVSRMFKLSFDGNISWVSAIVPIPLTSEWITFSGCIIILIIGILVAYAAFRGNHQRSIMQQLSVHKAAVILANSTPMLMHTGVLRSQDEEKQHSHKTDEDTHEFEITHMTLCHRSNDSLKHVALGSILLLATEIADEGLPSTYTF